MSHRDASHLAGAGGAGAGDQGAQRGAEGPAEAAPGERAAPSHEGRDLVPTTPIPGVGVVVTRRAGGAEPPQMTSGSRPSRSSWCRLLPPSTLRDSQRADTARPHPAAWTGAASSPHKPYETVSGLTLPGPIPLHGLVPPRPYPAPLSRRQSRRPAAWTGRGAGVWAE